MLRRYAARPGAGTVLAPGLLLRAAAFLALVAVQAWVFFDVAPAADVRGTFVILSTWVALEAVLPVPGASPQGAA